MDEKCFTILEQIQRLKYEVEELSQKPELTEKDTLIIREKQYIILSKITELDRLTYQYRQIFGTISKFSQNLDKLLEDPRKVHSSSEFEKKFQESLSYNMMSTFIQDEEERERAIEKKIEKDKRERRFDLPRAEYPEDKLPRVIVCGHAEDELPKIIVAGRERKGIKKHSETLTEDMKKEKKQNAEKIFIKNIFSWNRSIFDNLPYNWPISIAKDTKRSEIEENENKEENIRQWTDNKLLEMIIEEKTKLLKMLPTQIFRTHKEDKQLDIMLAESDKEGREKYFEKLTNRLTESLTMQEKLVQENVQLEGGKYQLEETLLEKDAIIENLEKKERNLHEELSMFVKENADLKRQLAILQQSGTSSTSPAFSDTYSKFLGEPRKISPYPEDRKLQQIPEMYSRDFAVKASPRGTCPAELEDKLITYGASTKQLQQQLGNMECEVHNMQKELANVQRERQQLEQQRKLLKCTGPCAPCNYCVPPTRVAHPPGVPLIPISSKGLTISTISTMTTKMSTQAAPPIYTGSFTTATMETSAFTQEQLRDLREQYARLQEDYTNKLYEVSNLRTEMEKMKQDLRNAKDEKVQMEIRATDAQERLKILETECGKMEGNKERLIEEEQALAVAKQRIRDTQDEVEELQSMIQDQSIQLEDYRNKYLQAQQQVEEQRRQLDLMEMDNARMNENVTLEIGRIKNQFQEKLAEFAPLPEILKQTQMKQQETQQMRLAAERNCENLSRELLGCKEKIQCLQNELDALRLRQDEKGSGQFEEMERNYSELRNENEKLRNTVARLEEQKIQLQKRLDEKKHENAQLSATLEQIRQDSARQVARAKERCESVRRSLQNQIAEMEKQLAQCRATARSAQKDRDEIRQKMQSQINNLNEAFEQAQGRIRSLQGHVNYLKTSYSNIFIGQAETPTSILPGEALGTGRDSCDCNY